MLRETTTFTFPSPTALEMPPACVSWRSPPSLDQDHASTTSGTVDAVKTTERPVLVTSRTCRPGGVTCSSPTLSRQVSSSALAHTSSPPSSQAGTPKGQSTQARSFISTTRDVVPRAKSAARTAHALWSLCSTSNSGGPDRLQWTAAR